MKKKYLSLCVLGVMFLGAGCAASTNTTASSTATAMPPQPSPTAETKAHAVILIKDDVTGADLLGVTSVMLTVDKVEAHSTSTGWVTLSTAVKQYDLLQLKATGAAQLLADANLTPGTYDQIRLDISQVMVTATGKTQAAKLPSNSLKIVGNLTLDAGQTSVATLDFILDKSLHLTGDGKYILAPVVHLQTQDDASVQVDANDHAMVSGGKVETDEQVCMDENGNTAQGLELPAKLNLDSQGMIRRASN